MTGKVACFLVLRTLRPFFRAPRLPLPASSLSAPAAFALGLRTSREMLQLFCTVRWPTAAGAYHSLVSALRGVHGACDGVSLAAAPLDGETCRSCEAASTWLAARALGLASRAVTCVCRLRGASLGRVAGLASRARRLFARVFRGCLPSTTAAHREPKTPCNHARSYRTLRLS